MSVTYIHKQCGTLLTLTDYKSTSPILWCQTCHEFFKFDLHLQMSGEPKFSCKHCGHIEQFINGDALASQIIGLCHQCDKAQLFVKVQFSVKLLSEEQPTCTLCGKPSTRKVDNLSYCDGCNQPNPQDARPVPPAEPSAEAIETHRCPEKRTCSKSYICYPAHHCDLDEGHKGPHVCDCGKSFRQGNEL